MHQRSSELQEFLRTLEAAIDDRIADVDEARQVNERIMAALREPRAAVATAPGLQCILAWLDVAVDDLVARRTATDPADRVSQHVRDHGQSIAALADRLSWWRRPNAERVGEPFASGHANAIVIGPGGIEERDDVQVGISLVAPCIDYPEHRHPPEELYLVLSPGHWQQSGGSWHEPGPGGLVHNPPNVLHAMRSGTKPLLATWCLWTGQA